MMDLNAIVDQLNNANDIPGLEYKLDDDNIILDYTWVDRADAGLGAIGDVKKNYKYIVKVEADGTYTDKEKTKDASNSLSFGADGISFGGDYSTFSGHTTHSKQVSIGAFSKDKNTGEVGLVVNHIDMDAVKSSLQEVLASYGLHRAEKKGFFSKHFKV
ncbi:MAG: hypothetical protein LBL67_03550 [Coriobacteriales bacterium]|jgi:hypothetical protein|nr:hypothetical protein [Coriobacteriales bacterium]